MAKSKDKNYKARKPGKRKSRKYATVQIRGGGSYRRRNANQYGEVEGGEEYTETRKNRSDNDLRKMYDKGGKIQSIESEIEEYELVVNDDSVPVDEREFAKAEIADLKEQLKQLKSEDTDTSKAEAKVEDIKAEVANIEADIAKEEGDTKKAKSKEKEADKAENKAKQIRKTKKSTKTKSQVKEAQEKVAKDIQKAKKRLEQRKSDVRSGKGKKTRRSEFMKRLNALVKKHKSLKAQIIGRPEENLKRDEGRLAKPVGYRFKGKRTRKPTADEVKKGIRNKTVYYEGRANRSDRLKSVQLAKGGIIGKIKLDNTVDFVGDKIKVFKNDFEVYSHDLSDEPYYSISLKNSRGGNNVWGGDSAWKDNYDKELAKDIFKQWDGTLYYQGDRYGYRIDE